MRRTYLSGMLSTFKNRFYQSARTSDISRVLVTGASGQIGQELVPYLRAVYGNNNVIASDIRVPPNKPDGGPFEPINVLSSVDLVKAIEENGITTIVHLAAILSAAGEKSPLLTLEVNNEGVQNVLEAARTHNLKVFCPSTIAVFGKESPKHKAPEDCIMRPSTMYGITKIHAELLGEYYHRNYGVDFRSLRYPGVISTKAMPGGGTTDYAVEMFHEAVKNGSYTCYLKYDTALPMVYMPDLLQATLLFMEADSSLLTRRVYNLGAMSFTPEGLGNCIKQYMKGFTMDYSVDFRQEIADTWPKDVDFSSATKDWGWLPNFGIDAMTRDILGQFIHQGVYNVEMSEPEKITSDMFS